MFLQNRAEWDIDLARNRFSLEAFVCCIVHIRTSYAKAGGKADGIERSVAADCAMGAPIQETDGVARLRGTEPPTNGCTCRAVIIFYLAVSCAVIRILRLFAGFVAVCVSGRPEYFVF